MKRVFLKTPSKEDLKYRKKWMSDPKTMSYNAGFDMELKGYDKTTGTITKTDEELNDWYDKWIGHEPNRYFAYIYVENIEEPVGEIYYYSDGNIHSMGIVIDYKYRGNGYAYEALMLLEKIAFEENNISELHDEIPCNRISAVNLFKKAGFIRTDKDMMITKNMYFKK